MGSLTLAGVIASAAWAADAKPAAPPLEAPFVRAPLDPPLVLTGNFGESRSGRYHAGLDFSTGGTVGREVFAPLSGWIERVRASGGGFGRSLYLHADDGRLIVFAHLDAFDEPLASLIDSAQNASGDYEQDLWPGKDRVRVAAGQRLGWSGESGAGPPHLHVEVRRGDVALNPLRAGMSIADAHPPALARLTLEPLDGRSFVQRSPLPWTTRLDGPLDTLIVEGRVRAIVEARDGADQGRARLAPWSIGVTFSGVTVECRFDSATWGGDMADADYVYDRGRAAPGNGVVLWHAGRLRPTVIARGGDRDDAALEVRAGDPARPLEVHATDISGGRVSRIVWVRGPAADEAGGDTARIAPARLRPEARAFEIRVLPAGLVRVAFRGAPPGSRAVSVCGARAVFDDGVWAAIVPFETVLEPAPRAARLTAGGLDAAGAAWAYEERPQAATDDGPRWSFSPAAAFEWWLAPDAVYEPALLIQTRGGVPAGTEELVSLGEAWTLSPGTLPLRAGVQLRLALPDGAAPARAGMYRRAPGGWESLGAAFDTSGRYFEAETRALGRFALMADTLAPRITLRVPRAAARRPYSRWALEASVREDGSGVDRARSWFEIGGRRVPTEWDAEHSRLRWRPRTPLPTGLHPYEVQVTDEAGNVRREAGTFVIR
jgi:hypothetical protein